MFTDEHEQTKKVEFIRVNVSKTKIKSGKNRTENIDYTLK